MKIVEVRLRQVQGVLPTQGDIWEERLARPLDIYQDYRLLDDHEGGVQQKDGFAITTVFLEIVSDEGVEGMAGPIPAQWLLLSPAT